MLIAVPLLLLISSLYAQNPIFNPDAINVPQENGAQLVSDVLNDMLADNSTLKDITKNILAASQNPLCATKGLYNTFNKHYYHQFFNRTEQQSYDAYLKTYKSAEKGRGDLNQFGLGHFQSLGDEHLIKRFAEFMFLVRCGKIERTAALGTKNLRAGTFQVLESGVDYKKELYYFASFNPQTKIFTFSFRGTDNLKDTLVDLLSDKMAPNTTILDLKNFDEEAQGAQVHTGFWLRFVSMREETTLALKKSLERVYQQYGQNTTFDIVITGHSLGGAWSFLQTADWVSKGLPISAYYTFGCPMVGNQVYVDALADVIGVQKMVRVVNQNDMIPHMGFAPNGAHPTKVTEYFSPLKSSTIKQCNLGNDPSCSLGVSCFKWSWYPHSELAGDSFRPDFCNITSVIPDSVYQ